MATRQISILAIDDNCDNLITLKALIKEAFPNATVFTALNGQQGLELAAVHEPDVILLDIIMPVMDGFEVCRRLKAGKILSHIPVVFITALKGDKENRILALECGAEAFLSKPIDEIELTAIVRAMVKIKIANTEKRDENKQLAKMVEEQTKDLKKAHDKTLNLLKAIREENRKRKKSETALLEAQRLAHIGSFEYDLSNNRILFTGEGLNICGLKQEDFSEDPESIIRRVHPEDIKFAVDMYDTAVAQKKDVEFSCRIIKPDGDERIVNARIIPVFDANGKHTRDMGTIQDITERKKVEDALVESECRYRGLFESAKDGIIILDGSTGIIKNVNPFIIQMLGYPREEYINRKIWEINLFIDTGLTQDIFFKLQKKAFLHFDDLSLQTFSGSRIEVEFNSNTYFTDKQKIIQCNVRDITQRRTAERDLKHSHDLMRYIIEHNRGAVAVHDRNLKYLYVSERYLKDFNIKEKDIIGKHHYEIFPDLPQKWREVHRKALAGEVLSAENDNYIRDNGVMEWTRWECRPWFESDGSIGGIIVYTEVITDRIKAQEALRESENLYRTFIDASNDMIYLKDERFRHIVANKNLADFFGVPAESVIGKDDFELMPKEAAEQGRRGDEEAISSGLACIFEEPIGDHIYESIRFPVKLTNQKTGVGGFIRDITARKESENNLLFLSYHDYLTGLYNRRFFEKELIRLDKEEYFPVTVIMCDLNGLKLINDSIGHAMGDKLLKKAAEVVKHACGKEDVVARTGGDEFVILMPGSDGTEAVQVIGRIKELAMKEKAGSVELSISCGYHTKESRELSIFDTLANAENHMYRHKLYESASMRSKTIDMIMNTLFEKSNRELLHSKRVSEICEAIAIKMNFEEDDVNQIRIAGLMHDIGKIGIDEKILNKPQKLDGNEWEEIKKHPEVGWRILSSVNEFSELAAFVLEHHERWDGKGYPNGLTGENISLEARIIAIADSFDAMTSDRSYRIGLSEADAMNEIERYSGTQFDPHIAEIFIKMYKK